MPITCTVPNQEEIWKAAKRLKNGKSAGPDDIPAQGLKVGIDTPVAMLRPLVGSS